MTRRSWLFALVLLIALPLSAARRHAVDPGVGRCVYGSLDDMSIVTDLAVDETHVYWWDDFFRTVKRVPKNGGPVEALTEPLPMFVNDIAVDDTNVYLAGSPDDDADPFGPGQVGSVPKAGGFYVRQATVAYPIALATDDTYVYWANVGTIDFAHGTVADDGQIVRMNKDGSGQLVLAAGLAAPFDVLIDGDVFFAETGLASGSDERGVRRVAKGGGVITHLDDVYAAGEMTSTATDIIYYGGELDGPVGGILRVAKTGGTPQVVVQDPNVTAGPATDGAYLYYLTLREDDSEALMRVPVAGGEPQVLYVPELSESAFAVDDCGLYWGTNFGHLLKSPK